MKILYTAEAVVEGGRAGHGRTSDGRLDVDLSVPERLGGMTLAVALDVHASKLPLAEAADLMERAHELCPYSNATRGNIDLVLTVDGLSLEAAGAA